MTSAVAAPRSAIEAPRLLDPDQLRPAPRRGPTLEEAVIDAWQELRLRESASCLVCGEPTDAGGECRSCGSALT